jgi:cell division septum initiation protein DivIVA
VTVNEPPASDQPSTEVLLRRVIELIENAKPIPLSATVRLENKDEVVELLTEAIDRLPDELRQARWLLKEREEFLAKVQHEGDDILDAARARAERMVQKTEIVRQATFTARRTVDEAQEEARRLRHEAEDYCDQKLAAFEIILERTIRTVQGGREKLQAAPKPQSGGAYGLSKEAEADDGFFDQDQV